MNILFRVLFLLVTSFSSVCFSESIVESENLEIPSFMEEEFRFALEDEANSRGLFSSYEGYDIPLFVEKTDAATGLIETNWGIYFRVLEAYSSQFYGTDTAAIDRWKTGDELLIRSFYQPLGFVAYITNLDTKQSVVTIISDFDPNYKDNEIVHLNKTTIHLGDGSEWKESGWTASSELRKWKEGQHVLPIVETGVFSDYRHLINLERGSLIRVKLKKSPRK